MDRKANSYIKKWLGLICSLSKVALFGRNILELPLKSISLGCKQEKAISQLKHQDIVGFPHPGRSGLGWGSAPKMWSKASTKEDLVITPRTYTCGMDQKRTVISAPPRIQTSSTPSQH
ncbi:Villin-1 [Labeo rohita]|uniref:Villin-1 n=1 Tax=Labeo rohita TaxID=84645 RepID=A0ABQ8LYQ7_LABRO|nr:Villin-1 [Labeo rohita]